MSVEELLALERYSRFYHFLCDELRACRTETEKKTVLSVLLTTRIQINRLLELLTPAKAGERQAACAA